MISASAPAFHPTFVPVKFNNLIITLLAIGFIGLALAATLRATYHLSPYNFKYLAASSFAFMLVGGAILYHQHAKELEEIDAPVYACRIYPLPFAKLLSKSMLDKVGSSRCQTHYTLSAEGLHKLSEWVLMPTKWFAQSYYRIQNPLPGAHKDCIWWGRAVRVSCLAVMAITSIPAIVCGVIGLTLRAIDHGKRPLVSYLESFDPANSIPRIDCTEANPFHMRTANLALTPTSVAHSIDLRPPLVRAREIGESIMGDSMAPSFIMAQEGWNEDASEALCAILRKKYPYILHNIAPQIIGMNSGMMVFSQHPIEEVAFVRFEGMLTSHSPPPRGILRVRLKTAQGDLLIYGVHTQSCTGDAQAAARLIQVKQLHAWVAEDARLEPNVLQIITGDLNTTAIEEDELPSSPAEKEVLDYLDDHFIDPFNQDHDANGLRTEGMPHFLAADNARMQLALMEGQGTWVFGPHNFTKAPISSYGYPDWYMEQRVSRARYDRTLLPKGTRLQGKTEHRRIVTKEGAHSPPSDHLFVDTRLKMKSST